MKIFLDGINFFYDSVQWLLNIEHMYHHHVLWFAVAFFFFIHSGKSLYELSHLKIILCHLQ